MNLLHIKLSVTSVIYGLIAVPQQSAAVSSSKVGFSESELMEVPKTRLEGHSLIYTGEEMASLNSATRLQRWGFGLVFGAFALYCDNASLGNSKSTTRSAVDSGAGRRISDRA